MSEDKTQSGISVKPVVSYDITIPEHFFINRELTTEIFAELGDELIRIFSNIVTEHTMITININVACEKKTILLVNDINPNIWISEHDDLSRQLGELICVNYAIKIGKHDISFYQK